MKPHAARWLQTRGQQSSRSWVHSFSASCPWRNHRRLLKQTSSSEEHYGKVEWTDVEPAWGDEYVSLLVKGKAKDNQSSDREKLSTRSQRYKGSSPCPHGIMSWRWSVCYRGHRPWGQHTAPLLWLWLPSNYKMQNDLKTGNRPVAQFVEKSDLVLQLWFQSAWLFLWQPHWCVWLYSRLPLEICQVTHTQPPSYNQNGRIPAGPGLSSVDQASGNLLSSSQSVRALHILIQTPSQFAQKTKQLGEMFIYIVVVLASGDAGEFL